VRGEAMTKDEKSNPVKQHEKNLIEQELDKLEQEIDCYQQKLFQEHKKEKQDFDKFSQEFDKKYFKRGFIGFIQLIRDFNKIMIKNHDRLKLFKSAELGQIMRIWKIIEIAERLYECMYALHEYSDIPAYGQYHQAWKKANKEAKELGGKRPAIIELKFFPPVLQKDILDNKQTPDDIFDSISELVTKKEIKDKQILEYCYRCCVGMIKLACDVCKMAKEDIDTYECYSNHVLIKSHEALGYWTCKLEEMKRGKQNVKSRTDKKEKCKAKLKEWMKTMSKKECRLKAQKEFDVTDRAVLNYLKEIKDEETAFLRNNNDTA
jgi:hypothetical protein